MLGEYKIVIYQYRGKKLQVQRTLVHFCPFVSWALLLYFSPKTGIYYASLDHSSLAIGRERVTCNLQAAASSTFPRH
jgi:hypothetical protein